MFGGREPERYPGALHGARDVSNTVSAQTMPVPRSIDASDWLWQRRQILSHDLSLTGLADPGQPFDIPVAPARW